MLASYFAYQLKPMLCGGRQFWLRWQGFCEEQGLMAYDQSIDRDWITFPELHG